MKTFFANLFGMKPAAGRARRQAKRTPTCEQLETRELKTAGISFDANTGVLRIDGAGDSEAFKKHDHAVVEIRNGQVFASLGHHNGQGGNGVVDFTMSRSQSSVRQIVFNGLEGNDTFLNLTGIMCNATGGADDDTLQGGGGNDRLDGGLGSDTYLIVGTRQGRDTIVEEANIDSDLIDFKRAGFGASIDLASTQVDQQVHVEHLQLTLTTSTGIERFAGSNFRDFVYGNSRDNILEGNNDWDSLYGRAGYDTLIGGEGNDTLSGEGDGDRYLFAGVNLGEDWVYEVTNASTDTLDFSAAGFAVNLNLAAAGTMQSVGGGQLRLLISTESAIENVEGSQFADQINGNSRSNLIRGGAGDDRINGGQGIDYLYGGTGLDRVGAYWEFGVWIDDAGEDWMYGEWDSDTIGGGTGHDHIYGGDAGDSLWGDDGNDWIFGEGGADFLYGQQGWDSMFGGDGEDRLEGGSERDFLYGGEHNDTLLGQDGDDRLFGDAGNDVLLGGQGADDLFGDAGYDKLFGEGGDDVLDGGLNDGFVDLLDGGPGTDSLRNNGGEKVIAGYWFEADLNYIYVTDLFSPNQKRAIR